jgi:hypothetical protein
MSIGSIIFCIILTAMQLGVSIYALAMLYQTSEKVNGIKIDMEFLKLDIDGIHDSIKNLDKKIANELYTNESDYNVKIGAHSYNMPPLTTSTRQLINNLHQTLENTNNRIEEISNDLKEVNTKFNNAHSTVLHQHLSPQPKTFSGLVKQFTEIQRNNEQKQKAEPYSRMESHPKKRIYQIQDKKTSPSTHYACGMRRPINRHDCLEIRSRAAKGESREFIRTEMGFARSTFYKALRKAYPEGIPLQLQL